MPTQFQTDCPHCSTTGAGFTVAFQWRGKESFDTAQLLAVCGICGRGSIFLSRYLAGSGHPDLSVLDVAFTDSRYAIEDRWPSATLSIPENTPDAIAHFYRQGLENLGARRWDAAGAMFRKTLDVATKALDPDLKKFSLFHRIEKLAEDGMLTPAMRAWSHEIRLDGNDAVHDEKPETEDDATISQRFAEAFLTYAFTLPAMVEANLAKRATSPED